VGRSLLLAVVVLALATSGCALTSKISDRFSTPGSDAKDLVTASKYPTLRIEIQYPTGYEPNAQAVSFLASTLESVTGRDAAHVQVTEDAAIPAEPNHQYTWSEIQQLEDSHRTSHTSGSTVSLYVMYVAGGSQDDTSNGVVLGAAYRGTSIVMFKGNIDANTVPDGSLVSQKPQVHYVEQAVLVHETGHAMGLVNNGAPMQTPHEDPNHPKHSNNPQSVMYWAVENTAGLSSIVNCVTGSCGADIPNTYDSNDKADLAALARS
jgi:hypothetical protein